MLDNLRTQIEKHQQERIREIIEKKDYPKPHRPHYISFKYAFDGVLWALKAQPNLKIHFLAFFLVILFTFILGFFVQIQPIEYAVLISISAMVLIGEMFNTSLEALGDEIADGKYKEYIRIAKDTASGGVLLAAISSILIGTIILIPKIITLF